MRPIFSSILAFAMLNPAIASSPSCSDYLDMILRIPGVEGPKIVMEWYETDPILSWAGEVTGVADFLSIEYKLSSDSKSEMRVARYIDPVTLCHEKINMDVVARTIYEKLCEEYSFASFKNVLPSFIIAENKLAIQRVDLGYVHLQSGEALGSLRAFDGTTEHYASSPLTPAERMFAARGKVIYSIDAIRRKNPGEPIFEMGNFRIAKGNQALQLRTKIALLKMWREKFSNRFTHAHFFAHVASDQHARLYEKEYGFKSVETLWMSDISANEQILYVDSKRLNEMLERQIAFLSSRLSSLKN